MPVIETVNIEDVYPLEDEHGNDLASRDYSLKENKKYVEELARSMSKKGIPDELVTLIRDGGIYRIKTGNSRIMAMRELGTKSFPAIIEDETTVEEAIATVIRTNTKKKYEAVEESRFVRQLALFSTDEYVSEAIGIESEKVKKIRRAAKLVEDAADDMSLLRLIAIAEFEDDPEAVESLKNCSEKEFPELEKRLAKTRQIKEACAAIEQVLAEKGIQLVGRIPEGMEYHCSIASANDIEKLEDDEIARHCFDTVYSIYRPANAEVNAQKRAEEEERARRDAITKAAAKERQEWFAKHVHEQMPKLAAIHNLCDEHWKILRFRQDNPDVEIPENEYDRIAAFMDSTTDVWSTWVEERNEECKQLVEILMEYGYKPGQAERDYLALFEEVE